MDGAAGVALLPFAVLAHVDEMESAPCLLTAVDLFGRRLPDARLRVGDEREESGRMLHGDLLRNEATMDGVAGIYPSASGGRRRCQSVTRW